MPYQILADVVVVVHLAFIVFVAVGSLLVWKWPRLVWPHLAVVAWAAAIVTIGFTCPLTPLEKHLRERAGRSSYEGGFMDHYLNGVVYPGRFTTLARLAVAALIVAGYAALVARNRPRTWSRATQLTEKARAERPGGIGRDDLGSSPLFEDARGGRSRSAALESTVVIGGGGRQS